MERIETIDETEIRVLHDDEAEFWDSEKILIDGPAWDILVPYGDTEKVYYAKGTVHFRRRQFDKSYEILAKSLGIPDSILNSDGTGNRWIVLDVVKTHDDALKAIKKWRQ